MATNETPSDGVLVAIDVDNILIAAAKAGIDFKNYDRMAGFERMFSWIESFGKILSVQFYMSPSQINLHNDFWNSLWEKYHEKFALQYIYCPKRKPANRWEKRDNVDAHLIKGASELIKLYAGQTKYFCMASGDKDYSSLLWDVKRSGTEIAFVVGSETSFSNTYRQSGIIGKHPTTGQELVHYFLPRKE